MQHTIEPSEAKFETLIKQLAYWQQQLAGAPPVLELPTDRPRPPVQSYHRSMLAFIFGEELTVGLKTLSIQEGVTICMTLTAAFQALLHRYTGQDDLLLGSVTASPEHVEVQNTVVLRVDLAGNPTFLELLERTRDVSMSSCRHADVPFEVLVSDLQPERNLSYQPIVQVILAYQPQPPVHPAGWMVSPTDGETRTPKFDLCLELDDRPEGLTGRFIYNTDLFDDSTISRMIGHWQTLLAGIIVNPARHLAALPLLTEEEEHLLLVDWNDTATSYPLKQCLHQLFEAQVERTPDAIAASFANEYLTYRQLNSAANQLAHHLQRSGVRAEVGKEMMVGICLERSLAMAIGILAVLKAGGVYVPMDPTYPVERLAFLLEDSQAAILLTHEHLLPLLPQRQMPTLCLDSSGPEIAREALENPVSTAIPENLAYVIYTSGSTGKPKGAMVEHRGMLNHVYAKIDALELTSADTVAQTASQCFDISVWQFLAALVVGGRVQIYPDEVAHDPVQLLDQVEQHRVSILETVPSLLRAMLDAHEADATACGQNLQRLRWLIPTGEALPVDLCRRWLGIYPHVPLLNAYGPTECSDDVTHHPLYEAPDETMSSIPIGRAIANMRLYVLDRHLEPLPIGVSGEVYVGGVGVGRGYLGDERRTAEAFLPDPFATERGARLYKTGDLARYLPDGNLEFLGRLDHQVKIRGFRIELGEIEAELRQLPVVREAVIAVRQDPAGDKCLVAYIVAQPGQQPSTRYVRAALQKKLPEYMLPAICVYLDALPLTSNGKVDHRALPAPQSADRTGEDSFAPPQLLVHHQLVQIWEELLDRRPLGIRDNFFHLGGHSLLAARLVARIEQVFGKKISLSTLLSRPTIEQLAGVLQNPAAMHSRAPVLEVQASGSKRPFFFLHGYWTGGAFYCFALARALGPEQPFYVLEPYNFAGLQALPTLETMAAAHLASLRAVQPQGPYMLGGFCNGGLVAYEMARQLRAAGQEVELLLLITPTAPHSAGVLCSLVRRLGRYMHLEEEKQAIWFLRTRHALRHIYKFVHPSDSRLSDFAQLVDLDQRLNGMFPPVEALYKDYVGVFSWQAAVHDPAIYSDKITFFWPAEEPSVQDEWRPIIAAKAQTEMENYVVPGTHMSCITEHVQVIAQQLHMCLSDLQQVG